MSDFWKQMIKAFLHDPPDKALDIRGHLGRAKSYLHTVLGEEVNTSDLDENKAGDVRASLEDRLPFPDYRRGKGKEAQVDASLVVSFDQGDARLVSHPLSGAMHALGAELSTNEPALVAKLEELASKAGQGDARWQSLFFALWRLLPKRSAAIHPDFARLPAETRAPDHTIWNHLDLAAAFHAALRGKAQEGAGGALLSFSLGPVQSFIAAARSLRDLWSGSYLLSWLTFKAMLPVVEELGPTALIYPSLRENPLFDWWLATQGPLKEFESELSAAWKNTQQIDGRLVASLPNTFMALVPTGKTGEALARRCRGALEREWKEIASNVHKHLKGKCEGISAGWDRSWDTQVEGFWDARAVLLPMGGSAEELKTRFVEHLHKDAWPPSRAVEALGRLLSEKHLGYGEKGTAGTWALHTALAAKVLAAGKMLRQVRPHAPADDDRSKCSLFPALEQMGPGGANNVQRQFWDALSKESAGLGARVRSNERLSAIGLIKRFFWHAHIRKKLELQPNDLRFDDTATTAAALWLEKGHKALGAEAIDVETMRRNAGWSGQWLHSRKEGDEDECPRVLWQRIQNLSKPEKLGKAPAYYAVVVLDGDRLGDWLRGRLAPKLEQAYHPKMVEVLKHELGSAANGHLTQARPLSPALHAAISGALSNFALHDVPGIVLEARGQLVYAGGDDVLAVMPTENAVACVEELRKAYQQDWGANGPRMGSKATVSAGLAIVHYKSDMREAIQAAREAEHIAKQGGRNALGLATLKRSGEHAMVELPWSATPMLAALISAFAKGASDSWVHQLRSDIEEIAVNGVVAIKREIHRVVQRGELSSLLILGIALSRVLERSAFVEEREAGKTKEKAAALVAEAFESFLNEQRNRQQNLSDSDGYERFIMAVQAASFMARGRDE